MKVDVAIKEINKVLDSNDVIAKLELYRYFFTITLEGLEIDLEDYNKDEVITELQWLEEKKGNVKQDWLNTYERYLGSTNFGIHDWVSDFMKYIKEIKEEE